MMTAREAMQQAIERAQMAEWEGARVFLAIAAELRAGTRPADPAVVMRTQNGPISAQEWARKAVRGDPGGVRYGTTLAGDPAYGRSVETEVMVKLGPDGYPVIKPQRQADPPIYERTGDTLGETHSVPTRIAHPQEDAVGPNSTCLTPECGLAVIWIKGRGWVHDTPSHTASCDKAAKEVSQDGQTS